MRTRQRTKEEVEKMELFLEEGYNFRNGLYFKDLVAGVYYPYTLNDVLKEYFKQRRWMRTDEFYFKHRGFEFQKYF